jgi:broad specificity phosphatase PhoE
MDELILARHGESIHSAVGLGNGDPSAPVHLTPAGQEQAAALGERLRVVLDGRRPDLCVISRFPRTRETADLALGVALREEADTVPRLTVPELDDVSLGAFEGRPIDDFRAWLIQHGATAPVPGGGESRVEVVARQDRGLRQLSERADPIVFAVLHGITIAYAELAIRSDPLPLTLVGGNVPYATPFVVGPAELARAIEGFEAFVEDPPSMRGSRQEVDDPRASEKVPDPRAAGSR